ncbi:MAG: sarcosine oxidase subunit gamma [Limimaricola sp.]|uniref:sarcosine oxidase subunit gamma n=1 Tax=Limimaricola sp. TaxID=2211665 RepID=UPI001DF9F33A|nr:sarcosine oxidase subunit gamma family protein [Limimaricola sp.]MBI1416622.1 sarcosine oxidase subunit gamma [Limimaricola sp.]
MPEATSALNGREASAGAITLRDAGLVGMITLRGNLASAKLKAAVKKAVGQAVPEVRRMAGGLEGGAGWMSPDELLLVTAHDKAAETVAALSAALKAEHHMAVNVSDARAVITLRGGHAAEVLAKLAPADLDPDLFPVGELRRTRLGQVAAAFWKSDEDTFHVICFRSVADYVFDLLEASAKAGPVGVF